MVNAKAINAAVKDRLLSHATQPARSVNWVAEFVALPAEAVTAMWGDAGQALHTFMSQMDCDHPDFYFTLQDKLTDDNSKIDLLASVVGLAGLAFCAGRSALISSLNRLCIFPSHSVVSGINTKSFVRCLKDPDRREEFRLAKKSQPIDMSTVTRKGEELWNTQPDSFDSLIRFEEAYHKEVTAAKRRADRFLSLGCKAMYQEVIKTVEQFQSQMADSYMGFNRLTFNAASVILAKWHKYELIAPHIISDFPTERHYRVTVPSSVFAKVASKMFTDPTHADLNWPYSPRIYPLHELTPSDDVREIVGLCENYHGYGGRPLFDHYVVMVPGIDYPSAYSEADEQSRNDIDKMLLDSGIFSAVVMGERDGKCYCLCVWS